MKKFTLIFILAFLVVGSMSSCCKKCTGLFGIQVEICRSEYDSDVDYNNAITALEFAGYNCQ